MGSAGAGDTDARVQVSDENREVTAVGGRRRDAATSRLRRAAEVRAMATRLEAEGRLGLTRDFIQHGDVSVYAHVCSVACASLAMADVLARAGVRMDRTALLRGALLHDYFLYDWHDSQNGHRLHGFSHPYTACRNAMEDFDLTARERIIIRRHMFPFVPVPPTCREAWIVCLADKWCALRETVAGHMPGRGRFSRRNARQGERA